MKKRILIAFITLCLVGCQNIDSNQQGNNDKIIQEEESGEETKNRLEFIEETFNTYNFNAPNKSQWQIKEEGPNKVVVIIKEPLITKLILIDNGSYNIEFLQIENKILIK